MAAAGAHRVSTATSIHLYAPFKGAGIAAGVHVARRARGYCWTSSDADPRSDAFRCFVGNSILDPCFADQMSPATDFVLCPLFRPGASVLRLDLTRKLPHNPGRGNPKTYSPWAVHTATGKWCTILTGATGLIAGMRINYGCSGGGILLGNPRRRSPTWTIFYAPSFKAGQLRPLALTSAWW